MQAVTINIVFAAVLGAITWALSPYYTGQAEPWDAEKTYYIASLFAAGIVLGFIRPKHLWSHYLGITLGQFLYQLTMLAAGPLLLLGVLFLFAYSLFTFVGAFAGKILRAKFDEMKNGVGSEKKNV